MEARRRKEYGFQGYQAPPLPQAMRSARRQAEGWWRKNCVNDGSVLLDLLATVAAGLFQEMEIGKTGSKEEEIRASGTADVKAENQQGEVEYNPKQNVLDLQNSARPLGIIHEGQNAVGNASQRLEFKNLHDGCSYKNAIAVGVAQRELVFKSIPVNEGPDVISQNLSRSTDCISKCGCLTLSSGKKRGPDLCVDSQVAQKQLTDTCLKEGEDNTGANSKAKGNFRTDACEEENVSSDHSLLIAEQDGPESRSELSKQSVDMFKSREGKAENDIGEINSRWWQMGHRQCENNVVIQGMHLLHPSSWSNEVPTCARAKTPLLVNSDNSWKASHFINSKPCVSFVDGPKDRIKVCRDDDDNSSECAIPSTMVNKSFRYSYIRQGEVRIPISSKFTRSVSTHLNKRKRSTMDIVSNTDKVEKNGTPGTEVGWTKKRTMSYSSLQRKKQVKGITASDVCLNIANTTDLHANGIDGEPHDSPRKLCSAESARVALSRISAFGSSKHSSNKSVKLSIKSFMVPELFVNVPESATVTNLKKAVMGAVVNLLGGGLQVSVLLHGKKVTDDSATLVQVGISHGKQLDAVGFMLESNSIPGSCTGANNPLSVLSQAATNTASRYPMVSGLRESIYAEGQKDFKKDWSSKMNGMLGEDSSSPTAAGHTETEMNQRGKNESNTTTGLSYAQTGSNSGAFTMPHSISVGSGQGLAFLTLRHKSQCAQLGKRRLRRPFTVAEVEILVQAVEKLGTGRWREIKLHAFDHAKHRTYVDLKDKWKTLVHTARIAPHQRRGEPVPLGLLDRVIHAHSYWSKQAELSL